MVRRGRTRSPKAWAKPQYQLSCLWQENFTDFRQFAAPRDASKRTQRPLIAAWYCRLQVGALKRKDAVKPPVPYHLLNAPAKDRKKQQGDVEVACTSLALVQSTSSRLY